MDLWIRSQQKEMLFKVNNSLILRNGPAEIYFIECDSYKIAMYKTYKRALEVLYEIQDLLSGDIKRTSDNSYIAKSLQILIYEMPKE